MRGPPHCGHRFQQNLGFEGFIWTIFFILGYVLQGNSYCKLLYQLLYCCVCLGGGGGGSLSCVLGVNLG